jgi:flagellar hook-basal body complex protein FliE
MEIHNNLIDLAKVAPGGAEAIKAPGKGTAPATSFADVLKSQLGEVTQLQQRASEAVASLTTGDTEDVSGVLTAVEKSELAFKTLLAIRAKLMDAYEELKTLQI